MFKKILLLSILFSCFSTFAKTIIHDVDGSAFNPHSATEGPLVIREQVNTNVNRWVGGDSVILRLGGKQSIFRYRNNGNWEPISIGSRYEDDDVDLPTDPV